MLGQQPKLLLFTLVILVSSGCTNIGESENMSDSLPTDTNTILDDFVEPEVSPGYETTEHDDNSSTSRGKVGSPETQPEPLEELSYEELQRKALNLPECTDQKFTHLPLDLKKVIEIVPLGNVAPPAHTLPTEHMYFELAQFAPVEPVSLYMPGDVRLIALSSTTVNDFEGRGITHSDFGMRFALCNDVIGYFLHIQELTPEIKALFNQEDCWSTDNSHASEDQQYTYCNTAVDYPIEAGTLIGMVGSETVKSFDFGLEDYRTELDYANLDRYTPTSLAISCPLDYFANPVKGELYAEIKRELEPLCGHVAQDIPGTIQGNWYQGEDTSFADPSTWHKQLALIEYNLDPSKSVISIGGVFADTGTWIFEPKTSGQVNRVFADVIVDGKVYCYTGTGQYGLRKQDGKILVQLVNDVEIKLEHQQGDCSETESFIDPEVYNR
jgi:hypothetical protein